MTLNRARTGLIARLDNRDEIQTALLRFISDIRNGTWGRPDTTMVAGCSREAKASIGRAIYRELCAHYGFDPRG